MVKKYKPRQGDIVVADFDPRKGHEQQGRRPALVVSNNIFNNKTGFALVCPITTKNNGFPLHILLPTNISTVGFVLTEHIRSVDLEARKAFFVEKVPDGFMGDILGILDSFYKI